MMEWAAVRHRLPSGRRADAFKRGIEPLADAGKLGALLAQFPAAFRANTDNRVHLASVLRAFGGYRVENDKIVTRYMADQEFQGSAFSILAREIFEAVRERSALPSDAESVAGYRAGGWRPAR